MGNICRSPTAEAVFRAKLWNAGLASVIKCDSAGTHSYHVGEPPDGRAIAAAASRGYDMRALRARQVVLDDFRQFDLVIAMDHANRGALARLCPPSLQPKLCLYGDLHTEYAGQDVPDPYYGSAADFEYVLDMVEAVSMSLLAKIQCEDNP